MLDRINPNPALSAEERLQSVKDAQSTNGTQAVNSVAAEAVNANSNSDRQIIEEAVTISDDAKARLNRDNVLKPFLTKLQANNPVG
jgi:hypothetical protein